MGTGPTRTNILDRQRWMGVPPLPHRAFLVAGRGGAILPTLAAGGPAVQRSSPDESVPGVGRRGPGVQACGESGRLVRSGAIRWGLRGDALALGALLAIVTRVPDWWARLRRKLPALGIGLVTALGLLCVWRNGLDSSDPVVQTVGYTVIAATAFALIGTAIDAQPKASISRFLGSVPLRGLGRYSYAIYIAHPFVLLILSTYFAAARNPPAVGGQLWAGSLLVLLLAAVISVGLGMLSWHVFEKHVLRLKRLFPYARKPMVGRGPLGMDRPAWPSVDPEPTTPRHPA